jgi:hypothetical protein
MGNLMQSKTPVARIDSTGKSLLAIPRVNEFMELVAQGTPWKEAAKACGIRHKRVRILLNDPTVRKAFHARMDIERLLEKPRNLQAAIATRDVAFDSDATAAQRKVALEAAKYLDGEQEAQNIHVHGNAAIVQGGSGYVIDLSGAKAEPKLIVSQQATEAKSLIDKARFEADDVQTS